MARYTSSSSDVDSSSSDEDLAYVTDLNSTYHTSQGRGIMPYRFEPEKLAASADGDHQDREQEERLPDSCEWCSCGHCLAMPDDPNNRFCCKEMNALQCAFDTSLEELGMEISCITDHPGFAQACLSVYALKVAYLNYRTQYGKINKPQNQKYRYTAYRQFVRLFIGYLGKHCRIPLPACVMKTIREAFPADGGYMGFKKAPKLD